MSNAPLRLYVDDRFTSPYALSAFVVLREKASTSICSRSTCSRPSTVMKTMQPCH